MPLPDTPSPWLEESSQLRRAWERYNPEFLDHYLVAHVEDPRLNCQSILSRAFLIDALWPGRFDACIEAELRFGFVLSWVLGRLRQGVDRRELLAQLTGDTADSSCPAAIRETYTKLQEPGCPIPDYLTAVLLHTNTLPDEGELFTPAVETFQQLWKSLLPEPCEQEPIRMLEVACGSANDARFFQAYGLEPHLHYTGFDLCVANAVNAMRRFPAGRFFVGDVLHPALPPEGFDYVVVHDLLEHLSPEACDHALQNLLGLARHELWIHLFSATPATRPVIRPKAPYYVNTLSLPRLQGSLHRQGFPTEVYRIADWLNQHFGFDAHYNGEAATLVVRTGDRVQS